jgi:hypothetical protein
VAREGPTEHKDLREQQDRKDLRDQQADPKDHKDRRVIRAQQETMERQ